MNTIYTYSPKSQNQLLKNKKELEQKKSEQKREDLITTMQMIIVLAMFALVDWLFITNLLD